MAKKAPRRPTPTAAQISDAQRRAAAAHPQPKPPKPAGGPIKVRATRLGYYDHARRREGDVFTIANEQAFADTWMERVSPRTPERLTTGKEDLRRKQEEISALTTPEGEAGDAGDAGETPEGDEPGETNPLGAD